MAIATIYRRCRRCVAAALVACVLATSASGADLAAALERLAGAKSEPAGQSQLAEAWEQVAAASVAQLPSVLTAMGDATPVGENWLRTAADAIAEREYRQSATLPVELLEEFVTDRQQPPRARRVAYEWLTQIDETAADRLLPAMLDDPSLDLRYDAVAAVIIAAEAAGEDAEKTRLYQQAFDASRNVAQIQQLADALRDLGATIDLAQHMGFVRQWQLIGPFDNADLAGFQTEYPPEREIDLTKPVEGRGGAEVRWKGYVSTDKLGAVNLNEAIGNEKLVVAYALAKFTSPRDQRLEVRLGSTNAVKLWLNGREAAAYEVYHSGSEIDQYVVALDAQAGETNTILVKACQNAKAQPWEQDWQFQLRVTDPLGGAAEIEVE
ncbi:MAG: hypothetical protein CMJ58_18215 [Planctomycetaceae bacterium]|nr:hypothetical protein [Planctomycetaceae bacterium]